MSKENALARQSLISSLAASVKSVCVNGAIEGGTLIKSIKDRAESMVAAAKDDPNMVLMVEGLGEEYAGQALTAWQSSIQDYCQVHDELPSDEVLASGLSVALKSLPEETKKKSTIMVESVESSFATSEGSPVRARSIGLVMPVLLTANTSDMVTHIPAEHNEVEIFQVQRIASTTFGDYKAGDVIEEGATGQYSNMEQFHSFADDQQPVEDGSKTNFVFDTALHTVGGIKLPIKRNSVTVYYNSVPVAKLVSGSNTSNLTSIGELGFGGSVNFNDGKVTVNNANNIKSGKLSVSFEVDIEKNYDLVPMINAEAHSEKISPSFSVIGSEYTHQAFWALGRDLGIDLGSHLMTMQRNLLAYNKDLANLTMAIHASAAHPLKTFDIRISEGHTFREHYQRLEETLNAASTAMLKDNKKSGIVGLYVGTDSINVLKAMGAPHFELVANYREVNRIHYAGKLFGRYKIFVVPHPITIAGVEFTSWDMLAYGRGENHSEAGIVNGDAIAPTFIHQGAKGFNVSNCLIALRYQKVHPEGGYKYFRMLRLFKSEEPVAEEPAA